jgi:preprotein translocase subunit SecA
MLGQINKIANALEIKKNKKTIIKKNSLNNKYKDTPNEELKLKLLKMKDTNFDLPEALQLITQLSINFFGLSPYDSQLQAALVLRSGNIAELGTGEGKTLSIVISAILNFLNSENTHIVTANDYLVERDYYFSKELFDFLGIKSNKNGDGVNPVDKKEMYTADVLYSTSRHLVFDYLNNNKVNNIDFEFEEKRDVVIIDEIDFVLIDEARTPIVISGSIDTDEELYRIFQDIQKEFKGIQKKEGFEVKEEDFVYAENYVEITDLGYKKLEKTLLDRKLIKKTSEIYDGLGFSFIKHLEKALAANYTVIHNTDYILMEDKIVPINKQTGRLQPGRRFSDGLQQAVEAKESIEITSDYQVLAQTTLQNYFKKYTKLSGTTGTAETESIEFKDFYGLKVISVAPQKPSKREDLGDVIFLSKEYRIKEILKETLENIKNKRPTLIGTQSLEDSEVLADIFEQNKIPFNLLNAKNHEKEAYIIAQAGKPSVVTIATNMAGRGTDIMLGGNKEIELELAKKEGRSEDETLKSWEENNRIVLEAGGLSIIGLGRCPSRRFDNQLIGRAGRQGDPGQTRFFLSLDDQMFMGANVSFLKSYWEKEDPSMGLSFSILTKIVRESQKTIESGSFNARKNLFKFDSINSEQREIFYSWRKKVLHLEDTEKLIDTYFFETITNIIADYTEKEEFFANDLKGMEKDFKSKLNEEIDIRSLCEKNDLSDEDDFVEFLHKALTSNHKEKMTAFEKQDRILIEKDLLLSTMDENYAENISNLEEMRTSTSLRSYAQKNPLDEYQKEALEMFSNLVKNIKGDFCQVLRKFSPYDVLEKREQIAQQQREFEEKRDMLLKAQNAQKSLENSPLPNPVAGAGV